MRLIEGTIASIDSSFDESLEAAVWRRWNSLTKPRGSLGRLEQAVVQLALIQRAVRPNVDRQAVYVFCGDHGVTAEGVSAYPSVVTREMVKNFLRGGAAINVLCRSAGIDTQIVDAGVAGPKLEGTIDLRIGEGTRNFVRGPAMSMEEAQTALESGIYLAGEASQRYQLVGLGEMGIGNSTSATALLCARTGIGIEIATGRGAGLDDAGLQRKKDALAKAFSFHRIDPDPIQMLAAFGGFEIAMMAGFLLGAAAKRLPVVVDGFISSAAFLVAHALAPTVGQFVFFGHQSVEPGHALLLRYVESEPLLSLGMRLGEGTGAALAMNVLGSAVGLYRDMATFEEAAVSDNK